MAYALKDHRLAVIQGGIVPYYEHKDAVMTDVIETLSFTAVPTGYSSKVTNITLRNTGTAFVYQLYTYHAGAPHLIYQNPDAFPANEWDTWQGEIWLEEGQTLRIVITGNIGDSVDAYAEGVTYEVF